VDSTEKTSATSIRRWKADFVEAVGALDGRTHGPVDVEAHMEGGVADPDPDPDPNQTLSQAAVELRMWKEGAKDRPGPSRPRDKSASMRECETARLTRRELVSRAHLRSRYVVRQGTDRNRTT
jgi:hypothetical protein